MAFSIAQKLGKYKNAEAKFRKIEDALQSEVKRHCLALDFKDDPKLIKQYEVFHQGVWPEILKSIKASGNDRVEIYRVQNRFFMIIEVDDSFSFEEKNKTDRTSPLVQKWETLMDTYQKRIPGAKPNEKWMLMDRIFKL